MTTTTPTGSRQPLVLDDEWEPPPRERRSPVFLAAIGLLIVGVAFVTIRAVWNGESARFAQEDWEAPHPVRQPAESPWSPIESAKPLVEYPAPPHPRPPAPRRQPAPRKLAFRPPSPEEPALSAAKGRAGQGVRTPSYVSINSKPWSAVSVDGRLIGNTPLRAVQVTHGRHQLALTHEGFETLRTWVTVQPGDTLRITDLVLKRTSP